ncbi:MAG: hypothetical protein QM655_04885 [Nocardioidaceae bacterium]
MTRQPALSRRSLLGVLGLAGTAALVTACRPDATETPSRIDPDVGITARALARESATLTLIDATIAAHPKLEPDLTTARSAHAAHVALLRTAQLPASPSPSAAPPAVAASRRDSLQAVAAAESALRNTHLAAAVNAGSGSLARLLASMSAASAQVSTQLSAALGTSR